MFSSQSEKRQSRLLTQLCVLLRILCQVFYNRTLTNSNLPHNRGHGFRKIITLQGCPNLAHHKLSRLAEVINIISSPLILGKSDQARHPGAQDISTMVKQVQQDLPACRHPDSSRAYLVSGHDRMGQATGFYQTLSFLEVAPQVARFGPTLMWSTGPGLLIKKEG